MTRMLDAALGPNGVRKACLLKQDPFLFGTASRKALADVFQDGPSRQSSRWGPSTYARKYACLSLHVRRYLFIILLPTVASAIGFAGTPTTSAESRIPLCGSFLMFDRELPRELWAKESDDMQAVGMDMIVVVAVGHLRSNSADPLRYSLSADGLLYPSR